jgi:SAM-dependent methyltransferase
MPATQSAAYPVFSAFRERIALAKAAFDAWLLDRERRQRADLLARLQTPWQCFWGEAYGIELKRWMLKPVFEKLDAEGKAGDLIVDVGSGAQPVTQFLAKRPGRKRILVDVAADNGGDSSERRIRLNAEKIAEPESLGFRKGLVRVRKFLAPAPGAEPVGADLMVFSDLLNYVDFRSVLRGFARYLKPGGRFLIANLPMRGNQSFFSEKGLKDNRDLFAFLMEERFEIEEKSFPCRAADATEEAEELIVLIARKSGVEPRMNTDAETIAFSNGISKRWEGGNSWV